MILWKNQKKTKITAGICALIAAPEAGMTTRAEAGVAIGEAAENISCCAGCWVYSSCSAFSGSA